MTQPSQPPRRQRREAERALKRMPTEPLDVQLGQLQATQPARGVGVTLADREGVWVHAFVCNQCGLHFSLYSWLSDRHRATTVWCPECGQHAGAFRHYRVQTSEAAGDDQGALALLSGHPGEIWRQCPPPGAALLDDTSERGLRPRDDS